MCHLMSARTALLEASPDQLTLALVAALVLAVRVLDSGRKQDKVKALG